MNSSSEKSWPRGFWSLIFTQFQGAVQGAASWLSWVGIAAAAITLTVLSGPAHLSYGQVFWVCGAVAGLAGVFIVWSRPRALPEMFARWSNSNS